MAGYLLSQLSETSLSLSLYIPVGEDTLYKAQLSDVFDLKTYPSIADATGVSSVIAAASNVTFEVGSADQVVLTNGVLRPAVDNDIDLGSTSYEFKDLYIDGTANIDTLAADAGTISGVLTFGSLSDGTITITAFVDEDAMTSNSATLVPTQQSVKAYVDASVGVSWSLKQTADTPVSAVAGTNYIVDPDSGALVFNLPAGVSNARIRIKASDNVTATNYVRLTPNGSEVIAGQAGGTSLDIDLPYADLWLVYNTNLGWVI